MKVVKQIDIYLTSKRNVKVIDVVQYNKDTNKVIQKICDALGIEV